MTAATRLSGDVQVNVLHRMWWAIMLRAAAVIVFAFVAFMVVGHSLPGLLMAFAIYAAADGISSIIAAIRGGGLTARIGLTLGGVVSLVAAGVALLPDLTWEAFATIVGAWAVVRGGVEFVNALTLRKYMERDWSLALVGMVSMFFGAGVLLWPSLDPWTFVRLLCVTCLIMGLLLALLAVRFLRGLRP